MCSPAAAPLGFGRFGLGFGAYRPQFAGLQQRLDGDVARVAQKLARPGVGVVNLALVDNLNRAVASIILGLSLLTGRGVPVAVDYGVKSAGEEDHGPLWRRRLVPRILRDGFQRRRCPPGSRRPGPPRHCRGRSKVRPLKVYHGKVGHGVSVEMAFKHGPVTLVSDIATAGGKPARLCAEAESVPGPILEIGHTNSRDRFACGAREFVNRGNSHGPAPHRAVGVSHIAEKLAKFGTRFGLNPIRVT